MLPNRKLTAFVKQTAAERKLPPQFDLVQGYGDDSAETRKSNGGVPTVNLEMRRMRDFAPEGR